MSVILSLVLYMVQASSVSEAASKSARVEGAQEIIEKAYALSVQKDREYAATLLTNAIKKETAKGNSVDEMLLALDEIGKGFQTEKGQQLFEQGLALWSSDLVAARAKLNEALLIEPRHLEILLALSRSHLASDDCGGGTTYFEMANTLYFPLETLKYLQAQIFLCAARFEDFRASKNKIDLKKSGLADFWRISDMELAIKSGQLVRAQELLLELKGSTNPEKYYWQWKLAKESKKSDFSAASLYKESCRSMTPRKARDNKVEPRLCRHVQEVEAQAQKVESP